MEVGSLLRQDRSLSGTDLQADAAVNAGIEINPEIIRSFAVFSVSWGDAGNRAGVDAISLSLADIGHDRVSHESLQRGPILGIDPFEPVAARLL